MHSQSGRKLHSAWFGDDVIRSATLKGRIEQSSLIIENSVGGLDNQDRLEVDYTARKKIITGKVVQCLLVLHARGRAYL